MWLQNKASNRMPEQGLRWKEISFVFNIVVAIIFTMLYWDKRNNANVEKYTPSLAYTYQLKRQKSGFPNPKRWKNGKLKENESPTTQKVEDSNDSVNWNDAADIDSFKLFLLAEMTCVNTPFERYGKISDFKSSEGRKHIYEKITENHGESARCNCIQEKIEHIMSPNADGNEDEEFGNMTFILKNKTETWPKVYEDLIPKIHKQCKKFAPSFEYKIKETKMECFISAITWWCFAVMTLSLHTMQDLVSKKKRNEKIVILGSSVVFVAFGFIGGFLSFPSPWFFIFLLFTLASFLTNLWLLNLNLKNVNALKNVDDKKKQENQQGEEHLNEKINNVKETNNILTIPFLFTYALMASTNLSFIFTGEKQERELETLILLTLQILPLTLTSTYMTHRHENKRETPKNAEAINKFVQKWIWSLGMVLTVSTTTTVCQKYNESLATPVRTMQFNTLLIATGILFLFPDLEWKSTRIFTAFSTMEQVARLITAFMITVLLLINT